MSAIKSYRSSKTGMRRLHLPDKIITKTLKSKSSIFLDLNYGNKVKKSKSSEVKQISHQIKSFNE